PLARRSAGLRFSRPGRKSGTERGRRGMKSLEQRLWDLEAREAIRELSARYAWLVARAEGAEMADLFTAHGVFRSTGAGHHVQGRENLRAYYPTVMQPEDTIP